MAKQQDVGDDLEKRDLHRVVAAIIITGLVEVSEFYQALLNVQSSFFLLDRHGC